MQWHGSNRNKCISNASLQFFVALDNVPDVKVEMTNSGSMTQEVFMVYAKHFIEALPVGHGPVMLFLDGHPSHWNKYALKFLMENCVFAFFLASHTSIWAQPNNAGVKNNSILQ